MESGHTTVIVAAILVIGAPPIRGEKRPNARLLYQRATTTADCPDERSLREQVSRRLGYDPFAESAERVVDATIEDRETELWAVIVLRAATGALIGKRELSSAAHDCGELVSATALAISIAIDPMAMVSPPVDSHPAPTPVSTRHRSLGLRVAAGGFVSVGALPSASAGILTSLGVRWRFASLNVEGRGDFSAEAMPLPSGASVAASLLFAALTPCAHAETARNRVEVSTCVMGGLGALIGQGLGVTHPLHKSTLYGAVGARVGAALHVAGPIWCALQVGALVPLSPTTLRVAGESVWTTPTVSGDFGFALVGRFP